MQGALFKYFRDIIMGYTPTPKIPDPTLVPSAPEERVGEMAGDQSTESTEPARPSALAPKIESDSNKTVGRTVTWSDIVKGIPAK